MKKTLIGLLTLILAIGLFGCAHMSDSNKGALASAPIAVMGTPMVPLDGKAEAVIMGAGFQPGQQVFLVITDANGIASDIEDTLEPLPKANATGTWSTTWSCGRFVKKKLVTEGAYVITVTDTKYVPLAQVPVTFYKPK